MKSDRMLKENPPELCPYLGLQGDPGTALAYSSELNCCTHARPVVPVDLSHQSLQCLTRDYPVCSQYNKTQGVPLSGSLRLRVRKRQKRSSLIGVGGLLVLAFLFLAVWQLMLGGIFNPSGSLFQPAGTRTLTLEPSTTVIISEITQQSDDGTATSQVTSSPTRRAIGGLETLLGYQNGFLIHRVRDGESLELLARLYGTAVESIKAINYELPSPLPVDWYLVIPVNQVNVEGNPLFEVKMLTADILVENLAVELSIDPADLEKFNNLDGNVLLVAGEWILIPRLEVPVP